MSTIHSERNVSDTNDHSRGKLECKTNGHGLLYYNFCNNVIFSMFLLNVHCCLSKYYVVYVQCMAVICQVDTSAHKVGNLTEGNYFMFRRTK